METKSIRQMPPPAWLTHRPPPFPPLFFFITPTHPCCFLCLPLPSPFLLPSSHAGGQAKAMQDERLIKPRSVRNRDLHRSVKGAIAADIKKNPLTPFNVGDVGRRKKSTAATATGKRKKGRPRKNAKKVVNEKYSVTTQRRRSRRQMQRSPSPPPCTDGSTVAVLKTEVTPVHLQRTSWRRFVLFLFLFFFLFVFFVFFVPLFFSVAFFGNWE